MNKFEDDIRKKINDLEIDPPHHIWASIENRLDEKKQTKTAWWKYPATAAATVLFIISSALLWLPSIFNSGDQQLVLESSPVQDSSTALPLYENETEVSPENIPYIAQSGNNQPVVLDSDNKLYFTSEEITPGILSTSNNGIPEVLASRHVYEIALSSVPTASIVFPVASEDAFITYAETETVTSLLISMHQPASTTYSLTAYFAPQNAYRYKRGNAPSLENLESEILSFSTGLMINRRLNHKWEIQAGAAYNRIGQLVNNIASFSHPSQIPLYSNNGLQISKHPQSMSTSLGGIVFTDQTYYFADISSTRITTLKGSYDETVVNLLNRSGSNLIQHFEFLEIPVSARYRILNKPFEISARAGLSMHYLLAANVYLQGKPMNQPVGQSVGVNKLNMGALSGLVFSYPVTPTMKISIEPTASIFIRPMGQIRYLNNSTYPYTWSVMLGISQGF
jgi:hypothetical protein